MLTVGQQGLSNLIEDVPNDVRVGITVVRMFLNLWVRPSTAGQVIEWVHAVMPVTADGFTAGAVPDPGVDSPNWYLLDAGMFMSDPDGSPPGKESRYDIHTARRMPDREAALLHVITNQSSSTSLTYSIQSRLLLRLH